MTDTIFELLRALIAAAIFAYVMLAGRTYRLGHNSGWRLISAGFAFLTFATLWDAADEFDTFSPYLVTYDSGLEPVLEDATGYIASFVLIFIGFLRWFPLVAEIRAARDELTVTNRALEARVAERTAELEKVSRAKSDFLARMSHELRTPLNAIIGLSAIMARESAPQAPAKNRQFAEQIHQGGCHLLRMVEEILDLSKIEAGRMQLDEGAVGLGGIAREAVSLLEMEAETAGVALVLREREDLPAVLGDEKLLRQIMLNLLSNAIKYTPAGGRVELALDTAPDGAPRVRVRDTGIGMSAEDLERVRQPFVQGSGPEGRKAAGTGLGLVLVDQFVGLHGGRFSLESAPGEGTVATVTLPTARVLAESAEPEVGPSCSGAAEVA